MPTTLRPAQIVANDKTPPSNIDLQRRLRRDLRLSSAEIADIDVELAIEAGLLPRPSKRS